MPLARCPRPWAHDSRNLPGTSSHHQVRMAVQRASWTVVSGWCAVQVQVAIVGPCQVRRDPGRWTSSSTPGRGFSRGRLRPGDQLTPSRQLAAELGVSRHTVTTAYSRLAAEGYTEGRA